MDDKLLASWNGLMIEALAEAGTALGDEAMVAAAARAAEAVERLLDPGGDLRRAFRGAPSEVGAFADDHAALVCGHLALLRATGEPRHLERAAGLMDRLLERFADGEGGLFVTAHDGETLLQRPRARFDESIPSALGLAARAMCELALLAGAGRWQEEAERMLRRHAVSMSRSPFGHGGLLSAHDDAVRGLRLVVVTGAPGDPLREALLLEARRQHDPRVRVLPWTGEQPPRGLSALVAGKVGTAAWVCDHTGCRPPLVDPARIRSVLEG